MVDASIPKELVELAKRCLVCALALACSHQPNAAKPRAEISGGAGLAIAPAAGPSVTKAIVQDPLLLQPAFVDARQALESGDDELASVAVRSAVQQMAEQDARRPAGNYLLGVIEERLGATARAIEAFENSAQTPWILQQDAWTHLIRLELTRKNCTRARDLVGQDWMDELAARPRDDLTVEVELCERHTGQAIEQLRRLIARTANSSRRAQYQVKLAEILLNDSSVGATPIDESESESRQLIEGALGQGSANIDLLERTRSVLDRLLADSRGANEEVQLLNERISLVEGFVEARRYSEARRLASELIGLSNNVAQHSPSDCRLAFALGRIGAGLNDRGAAIEAFGRVAEHCGDIDLAARALFLLAGQLAAQGKRVEAIAAYERLERKFPTHRLADDARLKQAQLHRANGSESRFVALLSSMPDDYPDGDLVFEGLFQLSLRSMAQNNWATALSVLERSQRLLSVSRQVKEIDSDRQRYFLARANIEVGRSEMGVQLLSSLVTERPLTYYMLLAYSTLMRLRPQLAAQALTLGLRNSTVEPQNVEVRNLNEQRRVDRLLSLLGVGDLGAADELLEDAATPELCERTLFVIAGRYANAGAAKSALSLVKRRGRDWRVRWPTAGWLELWQQAFPRPYRATVMRESKRSGTDESLIYAIMREESEFDPKAISQAEAYGLMQVIVPTAQIAGRELGIAIDPAALQRPMVNIAIGSRVLSKLAERFSGQAALIAAGYNAGPGRAQRWLRSHPEADMDVWVELIEYPETRAYVKRVLESRAAYRWLYEAAESAGASIEVLPRQLELSGHR